MVPNQADRTIAFRRAYGKAAPPENVTQEAFEGNDRHLHRLLRIKPDERPDLQDLWEYLQDLRHTDIQSSLLAYLLPFCLELALGSEGPQQCYFRENTWKRHFLVTSSPAYGLLEITLD